MNVLRAEISRVLISGMTGALSIFALPCCSASAQDASLSPPKPSADYAVRGKTSPDGGELQISYSGGRMRLEVSMPTLGSMLTGIVDFSNGKTVILSDLPGMDVVGFEIDMPPEYGFANMPANSVRGEHTSVNSEPCDIWRSAASSQIPIEVCLTDDGIPLKANVVTLRGEKMGFEATELERTEQDPANFVVPKGVKVRRVPRGMESMIPGLKR